MIYNWIFDADDAGIIKFDALTGESSGGFTLARIC